MLVWNFVVRDYHVCPAAEYQGIERYKKKKKKLEKKYDESMDM